MFPVLSVFGLHHLDQPRVRKVRGLQNNPFPRPTLRGGLLNTLPRDLLRAVSQELVNGTLAGAGRDEPQTRGVCRASRDGDLTELGHEEAWGFSLGNRDSGGICNEDMAG